MSDNQTMEMAEVDYPVEVRYPAVVGLNGPKGDRPL